MKKIVLINIFVIIFLILFFEFTINFFKLSNLLGIQKGIIYNLNGTHYLKPNSTGEVFGEKVVTDKNGFRVPEKNFAYTGNKSFYIIGDSTTFGPGIKEEQTFIGLLRDRYLNINFYNSSVMGYQINHHILNLKKINNFGQIKKIIYFYTLNDVFNTSNIEDANVNKNNVSEGSFKLREIKIINLINKFLRGKSYLYLYIKGIATDPSKRWYSSVDKFYRENTINFIKNDLEKIYNYSNSINADLHVVVLPYEFQTRRCTLKNLVPQKKITKILSNLQINYSDLTKDFCNLNKPNNYFLKFDPMHLSIRGHKFVYNLIQNEINF